MNRSTGGFSFSTGGRFETLLSPMGVDGALRKVSANLRSAYRLLYATVPDLKKRDLDLRVARKDTKVLLPAASTREATPREPPPAIQRQPFEVWMLESLGALGVKRLKPEHLEHIAGVIGFCRSAFERNQTVQGTSSSVIVSTAGRFLSGLNWMSSVT